MSKSTKMSKKFCKVCFDAGKEENEYTSHFVRSSPTKNSVVVCPLLLSLHCNYCKEKGHTIKYCKVLLVKQKQHKKGKPLEKVETKKEDVKKNQNIFGSLYESDEEEEMCQVPVPVPVGTSWASIVAKPMPIESHRDMGVKAMECAPKKKTMNWADMESDSDDDW